MTLTEDKGIHDDTRDGCSNHKAKSGVDVEIRGESSTNPKHCLDCQADEDDDSPTVPGRDISKLGHRSKPNLQMVLMKNSETAHDLKIRNPERNAEDKTGGQA